MEYKHLEYVLKIAEEKNISKAAEKLYISQPSLSQFLKKIETELHVPLFDRGKTELTPTYIGKLYLDKAKKILSIEDDFQKKVDDILQLKSGKLLIGSSPFRSTYLLSKFIPYFKKKYPSISLKLKESTTLHLEKLVSNGSVDFAISLHPINKQKFYAKDLFNEEIYLVLPKNHYLSKKYKLNPGELNNLPYISLNEIRDENFIIVNKKQKLHKMIIDQCKKYNFYPKICFETKSMTTAHALVNAGIGISLLPHTLLYALSNNQDSSCYLKLLDTPIRTSTVIWSKNKYLSFAAKTFINELNSYCKKLYN